SRAGELPPGATTRMPVGTEIAQPHPAPIGTVGLRAKMRRRVHLARAAPHGDDARWWGAGSLWARHSCLRTGLAVGLAGMCRTGLRDPRALAGWWYALGWPRDACGVTTGPGSLQHAAQPEQTQQHQLGEKEVGYHCVAPFHGGETGALYLFCRLLNYPHDRGTRPNIRTAARTSSQVCNGVESCYTALHNAPTGPSNESRSNRHATCHQKPTLHQF